LANGTVVVLFYDLFRDHIFETIPAANSLHRERD